MALYLIRFGAPGAKEFIAGQYKTPPYANWEAIEALQVSGGPDSAYGIDRSAHSARGANTPYDVSISIGSNATTPRLIQALSLGTIFGVVNAIFFTDDKPILPKLKWTFSGVSINSVSISNFGGISVSQFFLQAEKASAVT